MIVKWQFSLAICLMILAEFSTPVDEPFPSFIRSSVESIPAHDTRPNLKLEYSVRPTFGDTFLPLRSAIESAPIQGQTYRLPLRDAVEYRPIPDTFRRRVKNRSKHRIKNHFSSRNPFKRQIEVEYVPLPFRAGSPYQEIVNFGPDNQLTRTTYPVQTRDKIKSEFDYKILCYITNWSFYRKGDGRFVPEYLDPNLCTHGIYAFASLDPQTLTINSFDPWVDITNGLYKRATSLSDDLPFLLALGGWTDSAGDKYSRLVNDPKARKNFISTSITFLKEYNFKGLHLEWHYPKCWQSDCSRGPDSDREGLTSLIREIKSSFKPYELMIGVAISGYKEVIEKAYDVKELSKYVDFMSVMAYDYHGAWEQQTGHVSPLLGRSGDKYPQYNTDFTMQLLTKMGADRNKLIMGIPFYGQTFTLASSYPGISVGEGVATSGPGDAGEFTKQPGMLAYSEICNNIKKHRWVVGRDNQKRNGPHANNRNQWVGYEDGESVIVKAKYVVDSGFGGISTWTTEHDDHMNLCCGGSFPLLRAINEIIGHKKVNPSVAGCVKPPLPDTPQDVEMTTPSENGIPGSVQHQHTTWPAWNPSEQANKPSTSAVTQQTWWPTTPNTTPLSTTTSTTRKTTTRRTTTASVSTTEGLSNRPAYDDSLGTTIPSPIHHQPSIIAGEKCEGAVFRPHPYNCNSYYRCILNELTEQFCAGGLHYNDRIKGCDWPKEAKCQIKSDEPIPEITTTRITTRRTTPITTTRHTTPSTTTRRTTSSTTTRRTTPSTTTRRTTPSTTTRRTTTTTTRRTTTTPRTTTTTRRTSTSKRPNVSTQNKPIRPNKKSNCTNGAYYPHEECDSFYLCVNGKLLTQQCGYGQQWNQHDKLCDTKEKVRCISVKKYLKWINFRASIDDPCNGNEFVPHPSDCNQFLRCVWNRLEAHSCPSSLHWNSEANTCDWPYHAGCVPTVSAVEQEEEENIEYYDDDEYYDDEDENAVEPVTPTMTTTTTTTTRRPTARPTHKPTPKPTARPTTTKTTPRPPTTKTTYRPTTTWPTKSTTTSTTQTIVQDELEPFEPSGDNSQSGEYKVVCYFTNWAWYRQGIAKFLPENIDTTLCTHIVYGFAVLDYSELTIRTHDSWADIDNKFYERVVAMKKKGLKVSLAVGGWNDSEGDKYSRLVRSASARAKFIRHAVGFIEKYGFDGLDLDWEYPVCWQVDCKKGYPEEKQRFADFLRELSAEFKPRGWLLTAAVSPSKMVVDAGYDVPALARYLDWIAVMTYDYHGQWDKKTGHVAPLLEHPNDDNTYFNTNFTIHYWMKKGAPANKIVMGMPLYGQSFTLSDKKKNGLNSQAPGPGQAGEFTRAAGFLAYYEICDRVKNKNWRVVQDEQNRMGPYAFNENQWVSYDDRAMIERKSKLIKQLGLAGGMIWALDLDDFNNRCGEGNYPLLTTIRDVLSGPTTDTDSGEFEVDTGEEEFNIEDPNQNDNELEDLGVEPLPPADVLEPNDPDGPSKEDLVAEVSPPVDDNDIGEGEEFEEEEEEYKVVCYFTNWAWYRQSGGKFLPEDVDPELCTHVIYGFAVLNRESLTIQPHDSWADIDNRFYERVVELKARGIKVTLAIGGWNDSAGDKYSRLVRSAAARARFVRQVTQFIEKHNFDGLDLDWEYPVCWQVDCNKGEPDEKEAFADLVKELSREFRPRGWLLSAAVSPSKKVIDAGYDVPTLSEYFDWISVMTYDFHGQWDKQTGHVAPMYEHPDDFDKTFNANYSIHYWISQGADPKKLIMGMPLYGQSFSLADNVKNDLNSPTYGGGEAGEATRARGFLSYYEICTNIREKGWTVERDRRGRMGPYAYLRDQWVSFDDIPMIRHKSEYVRAMDLGGAMVWALDLDDFKNICGCESYPLLKTINRVLRNYPTNSLRCQLENVQGQKPTKPPMITSTTMSNIPIHKPGDEMKCNEGKIFEQHESDCSKYYLCQYGFFEEQSCPDGLYWNRDHCDWPENTKCDLDGVEKPTSVRPTLTTTTRRTTTRTTPRPTTTTRRTTTRRPSTSRPSKTPTSTPPTTALDEVFERPSSSYKMVCYFTNWAWYRQGDGKYTPDDIETSLCTHIVYGFAVLNGETLIMRTHDSWADIDNRFYERVTELKAKGVRVTLAIGGWNDSLGDKYSRLVRSASARRRFIETTIGFIEKYGFEGLDLDWEYPVCWQVDCKKGSADEKEGFANLVRELHDEFEPRGWFLSAAVSPSKMVIDAGYDVPILAKYFDWIAVMTYDFHGHWDKETGHVAPLYYVEGDKYEYFNANFSIRYWMELGAPAEKLVMGMPLYGQSFSLADSSKRGLNSKSYGPGEAGQFTRAGGFLAYYEICEKVNNGGWDVVRDEQGRIGPYASRGNQWVSYDDVEDIRRKTKFIKSLNLGGAMIWALDLDDFRGKCGCGKHPLLRTINQELYDLPGQRSPDCT